MATLNSLDKDSMAVTKSRGLNAEPWCILTFTSKPLFLQLFLHQYTYIEYQYTCVEYQKPKILYTFGQILIV